MDEDTKSPLLKDEERRDIDKQEFNEIENIWCPDDLTCFLSTISLSWLFIPLGSYARVVKESEIYVLLYWGKVCGAITKAGLHCVNPIGLTELKVSTKQRSIDLPNVKILDCKGNPIIVSAIVRYRVVDAIQALLEVEDYALYIENQAQAILKLVCSRYPYNTNDDSPSLKSDAKRIQEELVEQLQTYASQAGVTIISVNLNELNYAPEIAPMMLIRQQAEARIEARDMIVVGAVDIVSKAMTRLKNSGIDLPKEDQNKAVTSLLTVLCSDSPTQPVVTTS